MPRLGHSALQEAAGIGQSCASLLWQHSLTLRCEDQYSQLPGCQNVTARDVSLLVVEDRIVMQKIIRRLLVQLGFGAIDTAMNGQEALGLIHAKQYDLILSDWNMDEMSGFELLKAVRSDPRSASIPFVLITAEAKSANITAAKQAGASGYLIKPFKLADLKSVLETLLGPLDTVPHLGSRREAR